MARSYPWSWTETILAVELADRLNWKNPRDDTPGVPELAHLLSHSGLVHEKSGEPTHRNPSAVKMKVANLIYHFTDGAKGLSSTSWRDKAAVDLLKSDRQAVKELAASIRVSLEHRSAGDQPQATAALGEHSAEISLALPHDRSAPEAPSEAEASAVVGKQEQDTQDPHAPLVPSVPHGAFLRCDEHGRPEPAFAAGEAGTLLGFLEFQRATFRWRTQGPTDEQLRRPVDGHPSTMTLGGMLKHLSFVEFFWFEVTALGKPASQPWVDVDWDADPDWDWHSADQDGADELRTLWEQSVAVSQGIVTELLGTDPATALDATHPAWGGSADASLRWILVHMIEEYARHNGHADLLREQIDGQTGE